MTVLEGISAVGVVGGRAVTIPSTPLVGVGQPSTLSLDPGKRAGVIARRRGLGRARTEGAEEKPKLNAPPFLQSLPTLLVVSAVAAGFDVKESFLPGQGQPQAARVPVVNPIFTRVSPAFLKRCIEGRGPIREPIPQTSAVCWQFATSVDRPDFMLDFIPWFESEHQRRPIPPDQLFTTVESAEVLIRRGHPRLSILNSSGGDNYFLVTDCDGRPCPVRTWRLEASWGVDIASNIMLGAMSDSRAFV